MKKIFFIFVLSLFFLSLQAKHVFASGLTVTNMVYDSSTSTYHVSTDFNSTCSPNFPSYIVNASNNQNVEEIDNNWSANNTTINLIGVGQITQAGFYYLQLQPSSWCKSNTFYLDSNGNFALPNLVISTLNGGVINVSGTYSENGSFNDPNTSATSWTATVDYGDGSGTQPLSLNGTNFSLSHIYTVAGLYNVTVNITDNQGAAGTGTTTVFVNAPPQISSFSGGTMNEGDTYSSTGSFSDTDSNSWTATVDYGDGSGVQLLTLSGMNFSLSHVYKDEGTYPVTVTVTDNQGASGTGTASVIVNNAAFTVGTITAPSSPVLVNTAITASDNYTDPGVLDTHTASWDWGDGNTTTGTVTETNGSGSITDSHTYTAAGVYTITLKVKDDDGVINSSPIFQYVAVYDSSTSFVGGKSFDNPTTASPNTNGKVMFGVTAKYNNNNILTGNARMHFNNANIDFASTALTSLATASGKAYLKGTGTVNGTGVYNFLVTGIDGSVVGGNDLIRFQIKDSSNIVVYDSQPGAGDTTDPTTVDATGSIRIH